MSALSTLTATARQIVERDAIDRDPMTFQVKGFDHLLLLDVVEHLPDPEGFLDRLRAQRRLPLADRDLVRHTGQGRELEPGEVSSYGADPPWI